MKLNWYSTAFVHDMVLYIREQITDAFVLFSFLGEPIIYALLIGLMFGRQTDRFATLLILTSGGMMSLWAATMYQGMTAIDTERRRGTLDLLVATPLSPTVKIAAKLTASLTLALGSFVLSGGVAVLITNNVPSIADMPAFLLTLVGGLMGLVIMGLWFASAAILSPGLQMMLNALEIPGYLLGCFVVSLNELPAWVAPFSYMFLPYWMARGLREAASGAKLTSLLVTWGMMALLMTIYALLAALSMRKVLRQSRQEGTLHSV